MTGETTHDPNDGLLVRLLTDPGGTAGALGRAARHFAAPALPAVLAVVGAAVVTLAVLCVARRAHARRSEDGARTVEILAPPEPDTGGAAALWANLHDLLMRQRRAPWHSRPYLAFEYLWNDEGLRVQLWVPGTVPVGLVERAVEAAWPGARVR